MGLTLIQVDAFTSRPFHGNPAAVCLLDRPRQDQWMQAVASEMNLSETAFVHREENDLRLRWFTPTIEVDLCGHATLATAHVLWEAGILPPTRPARFLTRSGLLTAVLAADGWIEMDFPADPPSASDDIQALTEALGAVPRDVRRGRFDYLAALESEEAVRTITPDLAALRVLDARGVIVTAVSDRPEYDFVSRFFGPAAGIDEDPVTGSAHCTLAPYWASRLKRSEMMGYQASARGGIVGVRLEADRVILRGQAVTVLRGELSAEAAKPMKKRAGANN
jgi:PhzF family phenazine biosynthesis protein